MLFNTIEKEIQDIITAIMLKKSRSIKIVFKTSTSFNTRKKVFIHSILFGFIERKKSMMIFSKKINTNSFYKRQ